MSNEVLVSEHTPPHVNESIYHQLKLRVLLSKFGHQVVRCGYCGEPHLYGYVCSCGYDKVYNAEGELVWKKQ